MEDGARVMVSSRKEKNVARAVERLKGEGGVTVAGTVCHVGEAEQRKKLIEEVSHPYTMLLVVVEVSMCAACLTRLHRLYQSQFLIPQTISTFGKLDILVSNAAVNPVYGPILEVHNHILR